MRTIPVSLGGKNTLGANNSRLAGKEEYTRCERFPSHWGGGGEYTRWQTIPVSLGGGGIH